MADLTIFLTTPDIVLVCCGGGGLVSGIASAIKLSGLTDCKIYAVEPIGCKYIEDFILRKTYI
jgi:threonine dehydratase